MTLDDAIAAVERTIDTSRLRVDRKRAQEDDESYLVLVLDSGRGRDDGPVANGPRLVDKQSGDVVRLTVPDALARARLMTSVES
ncbi:hypothetical protein [Nocardioides sp. SYSU D00065]|uniref:hypothetical protein n=1 Tax=Nocardioides sp. SYSU D00065 TaxID=2817378 RepID=UPI001B33CCAB|nr:hypothetical protein [Nocardioides sp. SYSU D00065]